MKPVEFNSKSVQVIVPCAGVGARFKHQEPKQYALIDEHTVLWYTLSRITSVEMVSRVWVVANLADAYIDEYATISPKIQIIKVGAKTRAESVLNGLLYIHNYILADDWILVHDAARCCVSPELITRLITELMNDAVGGIVAIQAVDTVKQVESNNVILKTIPRNLIYLSQTPQMFRYGILLNVLLAMQQNSCLHLVTDESSAVENAGYLVKFITGDVFNIKITYPEDILLAKFIFSQKPNIIK